MDPGVLRRLDGIDVLVLEADDLTAGGLRARRPT